MSRYMLNKFMWEVDSGDEALTAFRADPGEFLDEWQRKWTKPVPPYPPGGILTDEERSALERFDLGAMYGMGCNPFLLWQLARSLLVPHRMGVEQLITRFREAVQPYGYPDFFT